MKNSIFTFILFALLLTVNAAPFQLNKRLITFKTCALENPVDLLTVKIGNNPPVSENSESFDVSGKLTKNDITKDKTLLFVVFGDKTGRNIGKIYTQTFNDPVMAGAPFNISASDVPTPKLPDPYFLQIIVGNPDGSNETVTFFACAIAIVMEIQKKLKFLIFINQISFL
ncbi:hypothetical protein F8M41_019535 [Gigaspora margarita]|uniref:MD-2-related lipid-recognition domain-containing protein n=1 Tax=Gigaspora margarita TaxID=4874 RepID=A0A8H4AJS3_GIGMA|nr:hypothetical protein F8M41_019535 [Gigaspora margarita]